MALVVSALGDRMKVLADAIVYFDFTKSDWSFLDYELPGVEKYLRFRDEDGRFTAISILSQIGSIVEAVPFPAWCDDEETRRTVRTALDTALRGCAKEMDVKFVTFMQTLRVAVTGKERGVDMYDALLILGQEGVLWRLMFALKEFIISPEYPALKESGGVFKVLAQLVTRKDHEMATAKKEVKATASAVKPSKAQATEEEIRTLAYYKWEAAGRPPGDGSQFWSEAEKELNGKK